MLSIRVTDVDAMENTSMYGRKYLDSRPDDDHIYFINQPVCIISKFLN